MKVIKVADLMRIVDRRLSFVDYYRIGKILDEIDVYEYKLDKEDMIDSTEPIIQKCPFCNREHSCLFWNNLICNCGAKYNYGQNMWIGAKPEDGAVFKVGEY